MYCWRKSLTNINGTPLQSQQQFSKFNFSRSFNQSS